jgi:gamma-glutamylcyclotransferase (GGCT)/AIG2-like uncharacterized protein YtfP
MMAVEEREHPMERLFLYGTLLPGLVTGSLAELLGRLTFVDHATLPGRLYDLGAYPGLIVDERGDSIVHGEVFHLPNDRACLVALDAYEGFCPADPTGSLYVRRERDARCSNGAATRAWVYEYNRDLAAATLISGGDYRAWVGRRR